MAEHSRNVEKLLKEFVAEISKNPLQPVNLQPNELVRLLEAQLENLKLKFENYELKCAKKENLIG
jgi:hypothetical protein